jgi:2-oxoglutarate ferredoxin oxidoreductase subunit alpha
VDSGPKSGTLALVGWGSTYGSIASAVLRAQDQGMEVSHIHLRHIWPLPKNLGELLRGFDKVLVPEMNAGQLVTVLRSEYLVPAESVSQVNGRPFKADDLFHVIERALGASS